MINDLIRDEKGRFLSGTGGWNKNKKMNEEYINKRREGTKKKWKNMNKEDYKKICDNISKSKIGHGFSKEALKKLREFHKQRRNKTYEEIFGKEKARKIKEMQSEFQKKFPSKTQFKKGVISKRKGKKYNEIFGEELAKKIKIKQSVIKQGIPLEQWKGFIKDEPYGEEFNFQLKNSIRKRDNQVCMNCGIHREKLKEAFHVHHINYDKTCNLLPNLISLCRKCHMITNFNREYWIKFFQEKLSHFYGYKYSDGEIILNFNKN